MEDSAAFSVITSSMAMEVIAVTRVIALLETQTSNHVCSPIDSMSMLRKIEARWIRREGLEAVERSSLKTVCFIFVPGQVGVKGN
jgi:hypothetical protein